MSQSELQCSCTSFCNVSALAADLIDGPTTRVPGMSVERPDMKPGDHAAADDGETEHG